MKSNLLYRILRKIKKIVYKRNTKHKNLDFTKKETQNHIYDLILSGKPFMISRFGSVELDGILYANALEHSKFCQMILYMLDKSPIYSTDISKDSIEKTLENNAGFFPVNKESLCLFKNMYINAIKDIDVLGSWLESEKYMKKYFNNNMKFCSLGSLEPYGAVELPWSKALKNKKVLVIHPFSDSIQMQYNNNRLKLFENLDILPEFELITFKAVQSIAGEYTGFLDWFQALDYMKNEILKIEFDIAILGCGAYGMPLASYIKSLKKQAIHLGGATQCLFGIKGKRWEEIESFKDIINEYWIRPNENEIPKNFKNVEQGCYW